ncbi:DUF6962 family protein [Antarcticimicrobium luteum]|uniref:Uncharacterized protein n=1 Tax=Antarcticimicrobium luteum TaxID=2547397 RepID=A0A4R5VEM7_9RHOB|nr:hypothetical protein [Antarcticimicrobium luteum]TDK50662.1 hypothetical protein E1832_05555 [Antarcticimicrobium luteum]
MISELSISAITDIILACELFFLAGLCFRPGVQTGSPAWIWGFTLALIGLASLIGAVDHGFYEPVGHPMHRPLIVATRITIIAGSLCMIVAVALQYLTGRLRAGVLALGLLTATWPLHVILTSDDFMAVILYYSASFLIALALSVIHLTQNRGTVPMILAIIGALGISAMVPLGSQGFWCLGLFGSYHVLLMPVVIALYLGGRDFRPTRAILHPKDAA